MYKINVKIDKLTPKKALAGLDLEKMPKRTEATRSTKSTRPLKALAAGARPQVEQSRRDESMITDSKRGSLTIPNKQTQTSAQLKDLIKNRYKLNSDAVITISVNGVEIEDSAQVIGNRVSCSVTVPHSTYSRKKGEPATTTTTTEAPIVETTTQAPVIETTTQAPVVETTTQEPVIETTTQAPVVETTTVAP